MEITEKGMAATNQRIEMLAERMEERFNIVDEKFEFLIEKLDQKVDRKEIVPSAFN
jgi:hypothetical protein